MLGGHTLSQSVRLKSAECQSEQAETQQGKWRRRRHTHFRRGACRRAEGPEIGTTTTGRDDTWGRSKVPE